MEAVVERDLRLPAEQLAGARDVGLALLRVVGRQRLVDDLAAAAPDLDHLLGQLEQGELLRVADVHRHVLAALGQQDQPADQVVDVTEAPRLRSVAEDGERLLLHRLADEGRDRATVVGAHPRAVGVEDPDDRRVHALLAVVGHRQRLGVALRLVVHAARADRVHVAPVRLRLRVHLRVAVDLARRRQQEARALELREAERVVRPVRADLQRLQRQPQVVDRARRAGEVVDEVHRLLDPDLVRQVARDEDELVAAVVLDVRQRARLEVVDTDDAMALCEQCIRRWEPRKPAPPVTTEVGIAGS